MDCAGLLDNLPAITRPATVQIKVYVFRLMCQFGFKNGFISYYIINHLVFIILLTILATKKSRVYYICFPAT